MYNDYVKACEKEQVVPITEKEFERINIFYDKGFKAGVKEGRQEGMCLGLAQGYSQHEQETKLKYEE